LSPGAASNQGGGNRRQLLGAKKGKGKGSGKRNEKGDGKGDGNGKPDNNQGAQATDQGGLGLGFGGISQAQQGEPFLERALALFRLGTISLEADAEVSMRMVWRPR
jgi:hypothetical protein